MRIELSKYIGEYVLCKGWITDWKIIEGKTFRAYIDSPVIKKPNKHIIFEEQELISIENHINLFLPYNAKGDGIVPYERYQCVTFAGIIREYKRKDGTKDYGIYPIAQSSLHQDLQAMGNYVNNLTPFEAVAQVNTLVHLEKVVKPYILHLEDELEDAGDLLPTFYHTYEFYRKEIEDWKSITKQYSNVIRCIHSNRRLRRKFKVNANFAACIPEFSFETGVAQMRNPYKQVIKKSIKKA